MNNTFKSFLKTLNASLNQTPSSFYISKCVPGSSRSFAVSIRSVILDDEINDILFAFLNHCCRKCSEELTSNIYQNNLQYLNRKLPRTVSNKI